VYGELKIELKLMSWRKLSKLIHFASTAWFVLCIGCILVLTLRQAGFRWWVIFSLSGYSALVIFLLVSLYLFAIFRGVDRSQRIEVEHPLTNASYYMAFYDITPFLGGLAGCIGMIGVSKVNELLLGIALGTLSTVFLVWIIIDPAIGLIEKLLPASREHRLERLAQVKILRQKQEQKRKRLLDEILAQDEQNQMRRQQLLMPYAQRLSQLLTGGRSNDENIESEVINIGVNAWRTGGANCMQQLYSMVTEILKRENNCLAAVDCISSWWDGIGSWRSPSLPLLK